MVERNELFPFFGAPTVHMEKETMELRIHATDATVHQGTLNELIYRVVKKLGGDAENLKITLVVVYVEAEVPAWKEGTLNQKIKELSETEVTDVHF